jgi:predicted nucleotidyltransferase
VLTQNEIDTLVHQIVERINPRAVIIFGSYAKGTATITSDLDILVIAETDLPMGSRALDLVSLFSHSLVRVDIRIHTPEEIREYGQEPFSFLSNILSSGKTVFTAPEIHDYSRI